MLRTKKLFFLIYLLLLQIPVFAHPFYVSICEINFNETSQKMEIAIKVYADDLIYVLEKDGAEVLFLGEEKEISQADSLIENYIRSQYSFILDNKQTDLNFLGKELDTNAVWCLFESGKIEQPSKIEVHCKLFTELYDTQENIIQITKNSITINLLLNKRKTEATLEL